MNNKSLKKTILVPVFILLIPLVAMQFTVEVHWSLADFFVAYILLFGLFYMFYFIKSKVQNSTYKIAIAALIVLFFAFAWAELAVGIL
jgi:hypothetical protein